MRHPPGRGVPAMAAELVADGAGWAYSAEVFSGRLTLLDHRARCVALKGAVANIISPIIAENGGRLGGLPDVIALHGETVIMREMKFVGPGTRDRLRPNQEAFARLAASSSVPGSTSQLSTGEALGGHVHLTPTGSLVIVRQQRGAVPVDLSCTGALSSDAGRRRSRRVLCLERCSGSGHRAGAWTVEEHDDEAGG